MRSPPSRRRGLKFWNILSCPKIDTVASLAEAWIEIDKYKGQYLEITVASLAEAWIEILEHPVLPENRYQSPPSRRRGLK